MSGVQVGGQQGVGTAGSGAIWEPHPFSSGVRSQSHRVSSCRMTWTDLWVTFRGQRGGLEGRADPEMLGRGNQWDSVAMWREGFPGSEQTQEGPLLWGTPCPAPSLAIGFSGPWGPAFPTSRRVELTTASPLH